MSEHKTKRSKKRSFDESGLQDILNNFQRELKAVRAIDDEIENIEERALSPVAAQIENKEAQDNKSLEIENSTTQNIAHKLAVNRKAENDKVFVLSRDKVKATIRLLKGDDETKKKKKKLNGQCKTHEEKILSKCYNNKNVGVQLNWDSPIYIARYIRESILRQEWDNVTELLLLLIKHSKKYSNYIKEISFLNVLAQIENGNYGVLEEFYKLCFIKVPINQQRREFDVIIRT